jgi:hypothetical protein
MEYTSTIAHLNRLTLRPLKLLHLNIIHPAKLFRGWARTFGNRNCDPIFPRVSPHSASRSRIHHRTTSTSLRRTSQLVKRLCLNVRNPAKSCRGSRGTTSPKIDLQYPAPCYCTYLSSTTTRMIPISSSHFANTGAKTTEAPVLQNFVLQYPKFPACLHYPIPFNGVVSLEIFSAHPQPICTLL